MGNPIESVFKKLHPLFAHGGSLNRLYPVYEALDTFFLTTNEGTKAGAHVRDPMDVKRLMIFVIYALLPCILMGWYNIGYQACLAEGVAPGLITCILRGGVAMLPLIFVSYAAGGTAEMIFAVIRKHEINEGFLVTAMLFPLTLPPTLPLWMAAAGIIFGVVIGKEVFGGVGMNILNPALTARAFVFFAYPGNISGAKVWDVGGTDKGIMGINSWINGFFASDVADAYTGATPLLAVTSAERGDNAISALAAQGWGWTDLFFGLTPGSIGEVSTFACLLGAAFLLVTGVASWRIMLGCVVGLASITLAFNFAAGPDSLAIWHLPWHYHFLVGGFAFGTVFMATDPCTSAVTSKGKWMYGIGIGLLCGLVRVFNPAYPEGMMLAILFMNVFAPLFDYYVVKATTKRRIARMAA